MTVTQKRTIHLGTWLKQHGIPHERVKHCTVDTSDADYYLEDESSTGVQVTHDHFPGWVFTLDLSGSGGLWAFSASLTDEARATGETITARRLRDVPIGDLALAARAHWALYFERIGMPTFAPTRAPAKREHSGPKPVSDLELATAMRTYLEAVADGHTTEEAARRSYVSKATMDKYRRMAVRRDLFISYGRGKPGGVLTDRAKELLKEAGR